MDRGTIGGEDAEADGQRGALGDGGRVEGDPSLEGTVACCGAGLDADFNALVAYKLDEAIVALSALLTTTMPAMKTTVDAFRAVGLDSVKIMIGGAPITQQFANEIGADGYSPDAASAVDLAQQLVA